MPDYILKTYLADGREHFLYGEIGDRRVQLHEQLVKLLDLPVIGPDVQIQ